MANYLHGVRHKPVCTTNRDQLKNVERPCHKLYDVITLYEVNQLYFSTVAYESIFLIVTNHRPDLPVDFEASAAHATLCGTEHVWHGQHFFS